ncbi:MAG: TonB family protein [Pyrinomonadaceae bacterium]
MKKFFYVVVVSLILSNFAFAQNQTVSSDKNPKADEILKLNLQVIDLYKQGKYDQAAQLAQQELALREKLYGAEDKELASVNFNLGAIYQAKKNYEKSITHFERALAIYRKTLGENNFKVFSLMNQLGEVMFLKGNKTEALAQFQNALATAEKVYGKDTKEIALQLVKLGDISANLRKINEADDFYLRAIEINDKLAVGSKNEGDDNERDDVDHYTCFLNSYYERDKGDEKSKQLYEKRNPQWKDKNVDFGKNIVNGKAKKLIQPPYPPEAKINHLSGTVLVRVTIDENGNVANAKPICGNSALAAASVEAAKQSKFSSTTINGKLVKVNGIIVYNFVAR